MVIKAKVIDNVSLNKYIGPKLDEGATEAASKEPRSEDPVSTSGCKDNHPQCKYWSSIGECEKNPG